MAKLMLKGIVKRVMPVQTYGANGEGRRQSVILFVPGWRDDFGDQKSKDEEWQLDIFNDKIDKMGLNTNLHEKKVECKVYVNSQKLQRTSDGTDFWAISATLGEMKLYSTQPTTTNHNNQSNGNGSSNW